MDALREVRVAAHLSLFQAAAGFRSATHVRKYVSRRRYPEYVVVAGEAKSAQRVAGGLFGRPLRGVGCARRIVGHALDALHIDL